MSCPSIWRSRAARAALAAACLLTAPFAALPAFAGGSATVFVYHRFGEGAYPSTNTTIAQLEAHIAALTGGGFNVMPLPEIAAAIRDGSDLPDRAVGISIDDAFKSLYTEAWPRLRAAKLPFTLFIATDLTAENYRAYMSWDQVREIAASPLVSIGGHTASHPHMPMLDAATNEAEIARANDRLQAELGARPDLFAYPYGEYGLAVRRVVIDAGFIAAFGQHSGVVHHGADRYFLPRFAMNETYGGKDRFMLAANALPLETSDVVPADPLLGRTANPPAFAFTVRGEARKSMGAIACYVSGRGRAGLRRIGRNRVRVHVADAFPAGRARINCTMPAGGGRWRWFGMQFYVPKS